MSDTDPKQENTNPFIHEDSGRRNLTALKRQQDEIHERLETLIALKPEERAEVPLDLKAQLLLTRLAGMKAGDPRSREMRYAAKLYAEWDDVAITAWLKQRDYRHSQFLALEGPINDWLEKLTQAPKEITEFMRLYSNGEIDRQRLRQLVRNAAKERQTQLAEIAKAEANGIPLSKARKKGLKKSSQALVNEIRAIMRRASHHK